MLERYKITYLEKDLYLVGAPVVIRAMALVQDTTTGRFHAQVKFQNIHKTPIIQLKAKVVGFDSIGRELETTRENVYLDLKAVEGALFGQKVPIPFTDNRVRKIEVVVTEVVFSDGRIWAYVEGNWEKIPQKETICKELRGFALDEYKATICNKAQYLPFSYKDVWICCCGEVNNEQNEMCYACHTSLKAMEEIDIEALKKKGIYRKAKALTENEHATQMEVEEGIKLFEKIANEFDVKERILTAKKRLRAIAKAEKEKKKKIILLACGASVALLIIVILGIVLS